MTKDLSAKFEISTANPELFSIHQVVHSPRSLSPHDLVNASRNVKVDFPEGGCSSLSKSFIKFLFEDFFVSAHSSGLYNRQGDLWQSIGRIASGTVEKLTSGWFFQKRSHPCDLITFEDSQGRALIFALLVKELESDDSSSELSTYLTLILKRINKLKLRENVLSGSFIICQEPFESSLKERVEKLVGASDPILKYESRLPEPALIPMNLVEFSYRHFGSDEDAIDNEEDEIEMRLLHPRLRNKIQAATDN